jgi:hypothetical protein
MDLPAAMSRLPDAYATALRLHDKNLSAQDIAECLGIEPEAVKPLLCLASAKLQSIFAADKNTLGRPDETGDSETHDPTHSDRPATAAGGSERKSESADFHGPAP